MWRSGKQMRETLTIYPVLGNILMHRHKIFSTAMHRCAWSLSFTSTSSSFPFVFAKRTHHPSFTDEDLIQVCQANVTVFGSRGKLEKVEHQHERSLPNTSGCKMYILIPKHRSTLFDECFTLVDQ